MHVCQKARASCAVFCSGLTNIQSDISIYQVEVGSTSANQFISIADHITSKDPFQVVI